MFRCADAKISSSNCDSIENYNNHNLDVIDGSNEVLHQEYVKYFNRDGIDASEIRKGMYELLCMDVVPNPIVITAGLHAARRVNDMTLAVKWLNHCKAKCADKTDTLHTCLLSKIKSTLDGLSVISLEDGDNTLNMQAETMTSGNETDLDLELSDFSPLKSEEKREQKQTNFAATDIMDSLNCNNGPTLKNYVNIDNLLHLRSKNVDVRFIIDEIKLDALDVSEKTEGFVGKVLEASWKVCDYKNLPNWMQDNDFLHRGHRPPLPSFTACFKSIFRLHTETGNIWTHLLGCLAFIVVALYFVSRPSYEIQMREKFVFGTFFLCAIICLGFSFAFHTLSCHSAKICKLFSKLDYCGIALLIMGSFVPWLYYGFYCHHQSKVIYLSVVTVLGCLSIILSMWDKFSEPALRPLRTIVFAIYGLSAIIPAVHYSINEGRFNQISQAGLDWFLLMGVLYITGAILYALRVPERWFPGRFDIWFQSHQFFHILVIAAAFVHYRSISELAIYRMTAGECLK